MRLARIALVPAGLGLATAGAWVSYEGHDLGLVLLDAVVGCVLVVCGAVAWGRRGTSRIGPLMALTGLMWFAGTFIPAVLFLHRGPLVHVHLSYPTGRLRRRMAVATVIIAYASALLEPIARNDAVTLVVAALVAGMALDIFLRTSGPARKAGAPALLAALAFAGVLALGSVQRLVGWDADRFVLIAYDVVIAAAAVLLLIDLLVGRWTEATVADLVVDLGERRDAGTLRERLAQALGDRSLVLGYWVASRAQYVDDAGRPVDVPEPSRGRAVTQVSDRGDPLAILVHDRLALDDPRLVMAVRSVAAMAVSNARLRAEVRARLSDLEASRRRIVEAGDAQRRRLELELRRGAEHRLKRVAELLELAGADADGESQASLRQLVRELDVARTELREFARGIHPSVLSVGGLSEALAAVADRAPGRVTVHVSGSRAPRVVEVAIYFICCEALTNVAKHAPLAEVSIVVETTADRVVTTIADDGPGGADPGCGSGLRGLLDRVQALGGHLVIDSPAGRGTTITVTLPTDE